MFFQVLLLFNFITSDVDGYRDWDMGRPGQSIIIPLTGIVNNCFSVTNAKNVFVWIFCSDRKSYKFVRGFKFFSRIFPLLEKSKNFKINNFVPRAS